MVVILTFKGITKLVSFMIAKELVKNCTPVHSALVKANAEKELGLPVKGQTMTAFVHNKRVLVSW